MSVSLSMITAKSLITDLAAPIKKFEEAVGQELSTIMEIQKKLNIK